MNYTLIPVEELEYVLLSFEGDSSLEQIEQSRVDLKKALDSHGWRKVLVDTTRITTVLSVTQLYAFAKDMQIYMSPRSKTALITKTENSEYFQFFEDVTKNRGSNYKIFIDPQQALAWLTADE